MEYVVDPAADSPIQHDNSPTGNLLPPLREITTNCFQKQGPSLQYGAICYWIVRRNESEFLSATRTIDFAQIYLSLLNIAQHVLFWTIIVILARAVHSSQIIGPFA